MKKANNFIDYYAEFGFSYVVPEADIKAAYRRLVKLYHPDINKAPYAAERMKAINLAYETLSDPQKKATYDNDYWLYKQGGQPYNYHTTSRTKYRAKTIVKKKWNIVEVVIHYIVIFLLIKLFGLMFSSSQEEHTYHYRADDTPIINVIYPPDTKQQPIKNTYREWFVADSLKTDFFIRKQKGI